MSRRVLGVVTAASALLVSWGALSQSRIPEPAAPVRASTGRVPAFLPGIAPAPAGSSGHYLLQHSRASALFSETGVRLRLSPSTAPARELGWSVAGARSVMPRTEKPRKAKLQRQVGPREAWERDVPTYGGLRYPGVLPGVELWFEEHAEGLEYGFRAERGADLRQVRLEYAGADEVRVVEEGRALEVVLGEGVLREEGLRCVQEVNGLSRTVGCRFTQARRVGRERWEYAITVDVEDPDSPVVVDPLVIWNTYLGSTGNDTVEDIARNVAGDVFIVGTVGSQELSPPADAGTDGGQGLFDVMVARFHGDGGLAWSTVLGGTGDEFGRAIAVVEPGGGVYVAGVTSSDGLAVNVPDGGVMDHLRGKTDGFLARLEPAGGTIDWFMYLGGSSADELLDIAPTSTGDLIVVGDTFSSDLPGTGGNPTIQGAEGFVSRLQPPGGATDSPTQTWTWLLQGSGEDIPRSVIVTPSDAFVAGRTTSTDLGKGFGLSMEGTHSGMGSGVTDAFVVRFPLANGLPNWGSYLGGANNDEGRAIALDTSGNRFLIAGISSSTSFPGASVTDPSTFGVFVTSFTPVASGLETPTFERSYRVAGSEPVNAVLTVDTEGGIYVAGQAGQGFVTKNGFDPSGAEGGTSEGFVMKLQWESTPVVEWSSLVGGTGTDEITALAVDGQERLFIGGATTSKDLRYADAGFDLDHDGASKEMFLLAVDLKAASPDAGVPDAGVPDAGVPDSGTPGQDAGTDAGMDAGTDAGTDGGTGDGGTGTDGGTQEPKPLLGWSCAASEGPGALALGVLVGLALIASRRHKSTRH